MSGDFRIYKKITSVSKNESIVVNTKRPMDNIWQQADKWKATIV